MEQNKQNNRGGARTGAGRKAANTKKVTISFRVTPETHDRIQQLREKGTDINKYMEAMIRMLATPKGAREIHCGGSRTSKSFKEMLMTATEDRPEDILIDAELTKAEWPTIKTEKRRDD